MTPTLLSASSAAYLAMPPTTSDNASTSVDGSTVSASASEESSDDHGADQAPSDFAVLLAAMMAPPTPAPFRPRMDSVDATGSSVASPAVGDATAATSVGLAALVALPSTGGATSDANPIGADVENPSPVNVAPPATPAPPAADRLGVAGAMANDATGTIGVPAGADPTPPMVEVVGRESPAPLLGLVALDRPLSLGRRSSGPFPDFAGALGEAPVDGSVGALVDGSVGAPVDGSVGAPVDGSVGAPVDGSVGAPVDGSMEVVIDVGPTHDSPAPAVGPHDESPSVEASLARPVNPETVPLPPTGPAGPPTVTPFAPPSSRLVRRSVDHVAPGVTKADGDATPMSIVKDTPAPTASTGTSSQSPRTPNLGTEATASDMMQSVTAARPIRVVREESSAPSDEDVASPVGLSGTPGQGTPTERPASVEGSTLPAVQGVRPGDAPQHIVRAALRAQAADGTQHMRLEMHPGDLGAVAVEVTIEGGAVHVAMVAERGETKDLLRSSIAELRSSLVAAGFSAGRVDIQSGLSDGRFGHTAERHDAWSQSFDRPDSRRDQTGAFANMFDQSSGRGDQTRNSRAYVGAGDRGDAPSSLRSELSGDRTVRDAATSPNGLRRDRLDLQL